MPKIVPLPAKPSLPAKLDKLANALADALLDPDVPVAEKIAGLKALSAYRDRRAGEGTANAFDGYRAKIAGRAAAEEEDEDPGAA